MVVSDMLKLKRMGKMKRAKRPAIHFSAKDAKINDFG